MSNHFVLTNAIIGGTYSCKSFTYTFFLPGGCCVVPEKDLTHLEVYQKFKDCPEDFIREVMRNGLNTKHTVETPIENSKEIINNKYLKLN